MVGTRPGAGPGCRSRPARGRRAARRVLVVLAAMLLLAGGAGRASCADPPVPPASPHAMPPLPPIPPDREIRIYLQAFGEAARNNWNRAHRLAARADNPLGARILRWWDYSRPGTNASFADIARFMDENPDWPSRRALQIAAEAALVRDASDREILAWYRWRDPISREGRLGYADALLDAGETDRAAAFVRAAWIENEFGAEELANTYRRYRALLRPEDHIARLDRLVWDNHGRSARRMFRYVDEGHRRLAEARLALRARAGGVDAAIARVPKSLRGDAGLVYERLRWRRKKGRHESTRTLLHGMPEHLGRRPELWWTERAIQVRRALEGGRFPEAYELAAGHRQIAVSTFAEAEWLAGWIALRFLDEPRDGLVQAGNALRHFSRLHGAVSMPISRARAAYWAGRAAEALHDLEAAMLWYDRAARYPGTFYGQLAIGRIGVPDAPLIGGPGEAAGTGRATLEGHALVAAVRLLSLPGYDRLVEPFIVRLGQLARNRADHDLVTALALSIGRADHAIRAAQYAARDGYVSIDGLFPLVDLPFSAEDADLEHALVLAVARRESRFDRKALSRAGARGLMQLMPGTARSVARRMGVRYTRHRLTADPAYNVALGSRYLGDLIERYDGSYLLAIAAYNAGPGNVKRWIAANGDPRRDPEVDIVDWIEMIPLRETRAYVQRVLEGVQVYRWRLGRRPTASSLERDLARAMAPSVLAAHCGRSGAAKQFEHADFRALC